MLAGCTPTTLKVLKPPPPPPSQVPEVSIRDAQKNVKKVLEKGILKILSKMGISLLQVWVGGWRGMVRAGGRGGGGSEHQLLSC